MTRQTQIKGNKGSLTVAVSDTVQIGYCPPHISLNGLGNGHLKVLSIGPKRLKIEGSSMSGGYHYSIPHEYVIKVVKHE